MALGELYNNALAVVENNNMGHTTIPTLKAESYPNIYKKVIEDKKTKEISVKLGWNTHRQSKFDMLNEGIKILRDGRARINDIDLIEEMQTVSYAENGLPELNGKDRTVAYCLACIGRKHYDGSIRVRPGQLSRETHDLGPRIMKDDFFDM